jgi:hypothetical protein
VNKGPARSRPQLFRNKPTDPCQPYQLVGRSYRSYQVDGRRAGGWACHDLLIRIVLRKKGHNAIRYVQQESEREEERIFTFKVTQLIWLLLGILEALIALRIGLKLVGANPESPIVALIYGFTYLFLFPFDGMIANLSDGGIVLELFSIVGMLVYVLIAWAVGRIVWLLFFHPRGPVVRTNRTTTSERHINP